MRTIAIVNQKGGCGKTITAINLSAFLSQQKRVLLIDMDPQGHATLGLSPNAVQYERTMAELFATSPSRRQLDLEEIICPISENLDLAPADILLSGAPERLAGANNRENILSKAIDEVRGRYDYIVIDCAPSVGLLTFNAVKACSEAIVPMDPSFFSLHGIGKAMETFDLLERETGHHVTPRVLVTLYPGRSPFVRAVLEDVHRHLAESCYQTYIRYSIKLAEAASHGVPITQYCKYCVGFDDYQTLAAEVLNQTTESISRPPAAAPKRDWAPAETDWGRVDRPGVTVTSNGVVFSFDALTAQRVQLAGDFNAWSVEESDMQREGRSWRKIVKLAPGRYLYRFIVDGQWQNDPLNPVLEACPGGYNSVLVVEDRLAAASTS